MALNHRIQREMYLSGYDAFLADVAISAICERLAQETWLAYIFGKAERLVKRVNGRDYYTPNFYAGLNEYIQLLPDDISGNYVFFTIDDSQEVEMSRANTNILYRSPFSIIFWLNMEEMASYRGVEEIKEMILNILRSVHCTRGSFTINRVYEKAENVWEGFTMDEVDNQFMMHPFVGLRFEGELIIRTSC